MADFCPTCAAVNALMLARGFSASESSAVSGSRPIRSIDKKVKKTVKRGATAASRKFPGVLSLLMQKHERRMVN